MLPHLLPIQAAHGVAYDNIGRAVNLMGKALTLGSEARAGITVGVRFQPSANMVLSTLQVPLMGANARITLHAEGDSIAPGDLLEAWDANPGESEFSSIYRPALEAWKPHWLCVTNASRQDSRLWWLRSNFGTEDWYVRREDGEFRFAAAERAPGLRLVGQSVDSGVPRCGRLVKIRRTLRPGICIEHEMVHPPLPVRRFELPF